MSDPVTDYAAKVVANEIIAGPHVRKTCERHLNDMNTCFERGLYFDYDAMNRVFRFFEQYLKLSEGQFEGKDFKLEPVQKFIIGSLFGWKRLDGTRRFRRAYVEMGKGNGKALFVGTPVPTLSGFTTMGDIQPNDYVFGNDGKPTRVIKTSEIMYNHDCYAVTFSDGETVIADANHLWDVCTLRTGLKRGPRKKGECKKSEYSLRTTSEIANTLLLKYCPGVRAKYNHRVDVAPYLDLPEIRLPIMPYTLGVWLGDGDSDTARITCAFNDIAIIENIRNDGYPVKPQGGYSNTTGRFSITNGCRLQESRNKSLSSTLRENNLLKNKHIPLQYLRASYFQRMELLKGLMDSDGAISKSGQCEFTTISEILCTGFVELLYTLGIKPSVSVKPAMLNGVFICDKYRITFYQSNDVPVFKLERKLIRQKIAPETRKISKGRMIVSCVPCDSVPVKCITVENASGMFLCGNTFIPTHNSPVVGGIGLYGMLADNEPGAQIYSAGASREQSDILFQDAVKMAKSSPEIWKRITPAGNQKIWNMACHGAKQAGSFFRPLARTAGTHGSGPRPHFALIDELHEHPDRNVMDLLERGFKFRRQPLLLIITNSGTDRNSICYEEHEYATKVASGEVKDDRTFSYVCSLDVGDDPLNDPSCWIKANPLMGVILTENYLAEQCQQARDIPGKTNGILRLHFCVWTDSVTAWISRDKWMSLEDDTLQLSDFIGRRCHAGLDLAARKDLCGLSLVFDDGMVDIESPDGTVVQKPKYVVYAHGYTPAATLQDRVKFDKAPYDVWTLQGHLTATPGPVINFKYVINDLLKYSEFFDLEAIAFDKWLVSRFEEDALEMGVVFPLHEHPQGFNKRRDTELWMPSSVEAFEHAILENRVRIFVNPALRSAVAGAMFEESPAGLKRFVKQKTTQRIDLIVAVVMAIGSINRAMTTEISVYDLLGDALNDQSGTKTIE